MIVEILGSLITSVVGGGATGLLGLLLQRWFDARKQANDLEILKVQQAGAERLRQMEIVRRGGQGGAQGAGRAE